MSEIPAIQKALKWLDEHPRSECCDIYAEDVIEEWEFHSIVGAFLCKWCIHRDKPVTRALCQFCLGEVTDGKFYFQWDGNAGTSDSDAGSFRQM